MEFNLEIDVLEANYGSEGKNAEYTEAQKDILWDEYRTVNLLSFKEMIKWLIRNSRFLPRTSQFYDALQEIEKESGEGVDRDIRHVDVECNLCNRLGLRWGIFRSPWKNCQFYVAVAKCSCRNSENWHKKIPTVAEVEANKDSGLIEFVAPGRLGVAMEALRGNVKPKLKVVAELSDDGIPF